MKDGKIMTTIYDSLISMTYNDAILYLKEKYGTPSFDYFTEKSYTRFMAGEIKTPAKNKITRTSEGLYCHHIKEDTWIQLSSPEKLKMFNVPFDAHKKDNLVYANLIEHAILHVLIAKEHPTPENNMILGIGGYQNFLRPQILLWFTSEMKPKMPWQINCYNASFLPKAKIKELISTLDNIVIKTGITSQLNLENAAVAFASHQIN